MNTAEKKCQQLEADNKNQAEQLEELFSQVDCLQEVISSTEQRQAQAQAQLQQAVADKMEHQKMRLDSDLRIQSLQRDQESLQLLLSQKTVAEQSLKELCQQQEAEKLC